MRKGEATRERILARAAEVFNVRGVGGASLADVMRATGLEKGGIYNHFGSKEQLALEAFDHAAGVVERRFAGVWDRDGAVDAVLAFVDAFRRYGEDPPLAGGCPVLNTAVESDDTHPALRARARAVADGWRRRLEAAVEREQAGGEVRPDVDGSALVTVLEATLEGALMLTKLDEDRIYLLHAAEHLARHIDANVRA